MNEARFWDKVREAINAHPRGIAHKLTDMFTAGTPDALYCIDGRAGVLELKYVPKWPVRTDTVEVAVTENQRAWLLDWQEKGRGRANVLLGVEHFWYLLDLDEIPPAPVEGKAPRLSVEYLDAVRAHGYGETMKLLKALLPLMLAGDSIRPRLVLN